MKTRWAKTVPTLAAAFVVLFTITGAVFASNYFQGNGTAASAWDPIPKQPMGVGTGVNPGRCCLDMEPKCHRKRPCRVLVGTREQ